MPEKNLNILSTFLNSYNTKIESLRQNWLFFCLSFSRFYVFRIYLLHSYIIIPLFIHFHFTILFSFFPLFPLNRYWTAPNTKHPSSPWFPLHQYPAIDTFCPVETWRWSRTWSSHSPLCSRSSKIIILIHYSAAARIS